MAYRFGLIARCIAVIDARWGLLPLLLLAACGNENPAPPKSTAAAPEATSVPRVVAPEADVSRSESLAGVADDADATPADLADVSTWRLPGAFTAGTSRPWLEQRFGSGNVHVGDVPGAEGETSRGVILFPDDPKRRAYVYFKDDAHLRGLAMLRVMDVGSQWQLDTGVAIGTPLSALVALNGKPLAFTGFDWDYGGVVSDWHGGRLQPRARDGFRRNIRLDHRDVANGRYPVGDNTFANDDRRYPHLGDDVIVGEISISPTDDATP